MDWNPLKIEIDHLILALKSEFLLNHSPILLESDFQSSTIRFWMPNHLSLLNVDKAQYKLKFKEKLF